jgi:DNA helicase-2/ATP-dependent DNA helicase PcrA
MTRTPLTLAANSQQLEAITTTEGPLLIIAGPGSGKTFTLVERIVSLLTEKSVAPERIMVVTFTDKAAQELTTRISNRLDQLGTRFNLNEMYLGTFHSICLRWLQDHRECTQLKHNFTVFDEFDQHYFVYQRFSAFETLEGITHLAGNPATTSTWERSESLVKWINTVSEEALDIQTLLAAPDAAIQALGHCAQLYYTLLEERNALDFSTIQREALHLLRTYPSVRDALKERIAYVMVDEYQDTNTIQERILLELVGMESPNLCVVGMTIRAFIASAARRSAIFYNSARLSPDPTNAWPWRPTIARTRGSSSSARAGWPARNGRIRDSNFAIPSSLPRVPPHFPPCRLSCASTPHRRRPGKKRCSASCRHSEPKGN